MKIKSNIILVFVFGLIVSHSYGQDLKLIEIETNQIVRYNAEQSWAKVTNWKTLHKLAPGIVKFTDVSGSGLYSSWQINLVDGRSIKEKMTYFNPSERTMSYVMTKSPWPIEDYVAIIKVEPYGVSKSLVSFYTTCKTSEDTYDDIKASFKRFQETYLSNLK